MENGRRLSFIFPKYPAAPSISSQYTINLNQTDSIMMKFDRFNHDEIQNIYSIQSITTSVSLDCKPEKTLRSIFYSSK